MQRLFVDTSAWFAFANRSDPEHKTVAALLAAYKGRLVTSNFVFDETLTLCLFRIGHAAAEKVGQALLDHGQVDLVRIAPEDETAAWLAPILIGTCKIARIADVPRGTETSRWPMREPKPPCCSPT